MARPILDVDGWLARNGVAHRGKEPWPEGGRGAFRWVLDRCGFDPSHSWGEAVITQLANGEISYRCHHNSCQNHDWGQFRRTVEVAQRLNTLNRQPYPIDALPQVIRTAVEAHVEVSKSDAGALGVSLLASCIGVVGNRVLVQVHTDWREPMVAWAAIVRPSGLMKSTATRLVEDLINRVEQALPPATPEDKRPRLVIGDTTAEAVAKVASESPDGLIMFRDELAGFLRGIGQYKAGTNSDEQFWISTYEGRRHVVDRRGPGSTVVDRLLVSVFGGIQPAVFMETMRSSGFWDSGFAPRFWTVWPERHLLEFDLPDYHMERRLEDSKEQMFRCMQALSQIPSVQGAPMTARMETDAARRLIRFANEQEQICFSLPDSSVERVWRSKSRGWVAKIAGLLALVTMYEKTGEAYGVDPSDPGRMTVMVRLEHVEAAIRLVDWQLHENFRTMRVLQLEDIDLIIERHDDLARGALDPAIGFVTSRDLQRRYRIPAGCAEDILTSLTGAGLWEKRCPAPGPAGGRPTAQYFPNGRIRTR